MKQWFTGTLLSCLFLVAPTPDRAVAECVDVAIVLAVDGSGSVSLPEYELQRGAIAAALRDADVLDAINRAGTVAISVISWGDAQAPVQQTKWFLILNSGDSERLARVVESHVRSVSGSTGLGAALHIALKRLVSAGFCAHRSIINVSGDGIDTFASLRGSRSPVPGEVKAMANAIGVIINALVISNEEEDLVEYFSQNVIAGSGAFVMEVASYSQYADAIRRKLIREIGPMNLSSH